jgi:uncharacterized cupin superfamily protein
MQGLRRTQRQRFLHIRDLGGWSSAPMSALVGENAAVTDEAKVAPGEHGVVPEGEGWFVLNAREAPWAEREGMRRSCGFEGDARFPELGINVNVLEPGRPSGLYHAEASQEDFLILAGECLLLIDGQERRLGPWDFVHCPPGTEHVFVGTGSGLCIYVAVGARAGRPELRYPAAALARRYGAAVPEETTSPAEAYAPFPRRLQRYRDGDLPDLQAPLSP